METTINRSKVVIGQYVHCILHGGRNGMVTGIHGQQDPDDISSLAGGALVMGGNASFDITWEDGTQSLGIPEAIMRGVQWRIYDLLALADEVLDAIAKAKQTTADMEFSRKQREERLARDRETDRAAYPHLTQVRDKPQWSHGRTAAANIRVELKQEFPTIKFSVTSDHNSVNIRWTNGPTLAQVEFVTDKYVAGRFNGMTDSYEYDRENTFGDVFGKPQYVFCNRYFDDEDFQLVAKCYCELQEIAFESINQLDPHRGRYLNEIVYQILSETNFEASESVEGLERNEAYQSGYRVWKD